MSNVVSYLYEFGPFRLDPVERLLLREGQPVALTPKAFDVLMVLVQRSGHLVEKRELIEAVWPGLYVEEGNVCVMVHALRKAFGSDHGDHKYIETVSKRGYRFAVEVRVVETEPLALPMPISPHPAFEALRPSTLSISPTVIRHRSEDWAERMPASSSSPVRAKGFPAAFWARTKLRWAWVVLAPMVLASYLLMFRSVSSPKEPVVSAAVRSLAVLPFSIIGDKSGDKNGGKNDDAYLGLGMSDAVTTKLGNTGKIVIRPTSALERYVGASRDPVTAGREQQVDAVLDGRIQRAGDRIRLTVQLIRVGDAARIWGGTFDEKYTNIFAVEDAVSEQVARSIRLELTGAEQKRLTERPTQNGDAYQAYVKGRYFWNKRTTEGLRKGLGYFQEAVALDPAYTQAYAGIGDSYALMGLFTVLPPKVAFPKAREAANKALEMDPELADAHATLGFIDFYYDWDGQTAETEFRHALRINPNYAIAHTWYAEPLAAMGRFPEALAEARLAQEADPLSLTISTNIGLVAYLAGQNDQAIEACQKAIDIDPTFPRVHFRLGNALRQKGMYRQALAEFQKAVQLSGGGEQYGDQYYEASVGDAYARLGETSEARRILEDLKKRSHGQYVPAFGIALIYAGLGEKDHVFEWLDRAVTDRSSSMVYLKVDPVLNNFGSDPRFASLAKHIRF